jgi:hypothetical protein
MLAERMADFAAVDQTILTRRVGLPDSGKVVDPIPLSFDKSPMREPMETSKVKIHDDEEEYEDVDHHGKAVIGPDADEMDEGDGDSREEDEEDGENDEEEAAPDDDPETVSVSHVVTNVMIFQSFLFELASLVQVRAGLFNEVRFV